MSIPGVDILGSKAGYSPERPWLFEDFDQISFYKVTEEEYERDMALFRSGRYQYKWEDIEFDMAEHNRLLESSKDEVTTIRARQREAQAEMLKLETELMERWTAEKAASEIPMDAVAALLEGTCSFFLCGVIPYIPASCLSSTYLEPSASFIDSQLILHRSRYFHYRSAT